MKSYINVVLLILLFTACTNEEDIQPQEIEFNIGYSFSSGNMSRTSNADIYNAFFNNYIATRTLTPDNFKLVFTNNETGQKNEVNGQWSKNGLIRLTEGSYNVTGTSYDYDNEYAKEKAVLNFKHDVKIDRNTKNITLQATWGCPLLFFSTENTKKVVYKYDNYAFHEDVLKIIDGYYYCFMKGLSTEKDAQFIITRNGDDIVKVYSDKLNLDNGKYYFFDDVTSEFELSPMQPGN